MPTTTGSHANRAKPIDICSKVDIYSISISVIIGIPPVISANNMRNKFLICKAYTLSIICNNTRREDGRYPPSLLKLAEDNTMWARNRQ